MTENDDLTRDQLIDGLSRLSEKEAESVISESRKTDRKTRQQAAAAALTHFIAKE